MNEGMSFPKKASKLGPVPGEVSLDGLEVVQAVQDLKHSVPLVANKATVVRVYLSRPSGGAVKVRGEIALRRTPGGPAQNIPSLDTVQIKPEQNDQLQTKRGDLRLSLNFLLPAAWAAAGRVFVRLASLTNAATGAAVNCANCVTDVEINFEPAPALRIHLVRLRYKSGGVTYVPTAQDMALIKSWLRRAYPVSEVVSSQVTVDADFGPPFDRNDGSNDCDDANAQVSAIRNVDIDGGADRRTHYYGLIHDAGGINFMRGCANVIPTKPNPAAVASGPTGARGYDWDKDGSYGDWYTGHELGHTFGRYHPGFCNGNSKDDLEYPFPKGQLSGADGAFVGFDIGDKSLGIQMAALPGTLWHDVMTYCPNQWLSSYTYKGILARLRAEDKLGSGPVPQEDELAAAAAEAEAADDLEVRMESGEQINVVATVNLTRATGKIKYVTPVTRALVPQADDASRVVIRLSGADGGTLLEYPAAVKVKTCREPGDDEKGIVDVALPRRADAAALELVVDGAVVDTFRAGGPPPQVTGIRRREAAEDEVGPAGMPEDTVTFEWGVESQEDEGAADAAAGSVTYNVQVSKDGGQTWQTVAVGRPTPDVTIERGDFADAESVVVRVVATNGFDSSAVTSDEIPADSL